MISTSFLTGVSAVLYNHLIFIVFLFRIVEYCILNKLEYVVSITNTNILHNNLELFYIHLLCHVYN